MSTIKTGTPEGKNIGFVWWTLYGVLTLTLAKQPPAAKAVEIVVH